MRKWSVRYTGPQEVVVEANSSLYAELIVSEQNYDQWVAQEIEEDKETEH